MKKIELLAPAGDMESFYTAIANGADAVYLGLDLFNARMKADNFSVDNIRECVEYAHFFGVKIYLTINTIVFDSEFAKLISLVKVAVDAKVDAFIVQDLGVCKLLKTCFCDIVIHASTQMGIHNLYGALQAEKLGIKRVVLSRETKLADIRDIRKNTKLELEFFVQGALCTSFSGNCYLSAKMQDASGNRGLCKQLCRFPYLASFTGKGAKFESQKGYFLSARDLSLLDSVNELCEIGIDSIKIEGRMRRSGYVAVTVKTYRKAIDRISPYENDKRAPQMADSNDRTALKKVFNRGSFLERAYLDNGVPAVVNKFSQNHVGVRVGEVESIKPFKDLYEIDIVSRHKLATGDGLKFYDGDSEKGSLGVGNIRVNSKDKYTLYTKTKVSPNFKINLILDSALEQKYLLAKRFNTMDITVLANAGKPLTMTAECSVNGEKILTVSVADVTVLEQAKTTPISSLQFEEQVGKLGDSGFLPGKITIDTDGVFAPKSQINALRRDLITLCREKIVEHYEKEIIAKFDSSRASDKITFIENPDANVADANQIKSSKPFKKADVNTNSVALNADCDNSAQKATILHFVYNEDIAKSIFIKKDEIVVLAPNRYTIAEISKMLSLLELDSSTEVAVLLPTIASGEDIVVLNALLKALGEKVKTLVAENLYGFYYAAKGYKIIAGAGQNVCNYLATETVADLGAQAVVFSTESKGEKISAIEKAQAINWIEPLMTLAHCPYKTIFENDCPHCSFREGLVLEQDKNKFSIRRIRVSSCYFQLIKVS